MSNFKNFPATSSHTLMCFSCPGREEENKIFFWTAKGANCCCWFPYSFSNYLFLQNRIKEIMLVCFRAAQNKMEKRCGYFDLLGFDFMVDEDMKVFECRFNLSMNIKLCLSKNHRISSQIIRYFLLIRFSVYSFCNTCTKCQNDTSKFDPKHLDP